MATTTKLGIRDYLKAAGYKDEDIGYDAGTTPGSSRVTLNGQTFAYATPEADGSTYSDQGSLNKALQGYRQGQLQNQTQSILSQLQQSAQAPATTFQAPAAFSYDKNTDPAYQAALASAKQNIATEQANTNARLRAGGQGRSSWSETVANQVAAKEMANLENSVVPQLLSQAYQQWNDQANRNLQIQQANAAAGNDRYSRLAQLLASSSGLYQQGLENQRADDQTELQRQQLGLQNRQANLNAALQVGNQTGRVIAPKDDWANLYNQDEAPLSLAGQQISYQQARDAIADQQYQQKFDEDVRQYGLSYGLQQAQLAGQLSNQAADNTLARERLAWEMSPDNPNNLYKSAQTSAAEAKSLVTDKESTDNYTTIMGDLSMKGITKEKAQQLVTANRNYLSDADYKKLMNFVTENF